jgi:hypothetical protein
MKTFKIIMGIVTIIAIAVGGAMLAVAIYGLGIIH